MAFDGFPKGTQKFLRDLAKNNESAWVKANRKAYEGDLIEPAKAFVEAMGAHLQTRHPTLRAEPRVGGSILRMNRDTRFSKDKSPYKTHLDMWFWEGEKKGWDRSGFYFRLQPPKLHLGAGLHGFDKPLLEAYRAAVLDDTTGKSLVKAVAKVEKAGAEVGTLKYKRVPRGLDPEHPRAELLRYGSLHAGFEEKVPKELTSGAFIKWCADRWKKLEPLHAWLLPVAEAAAAKR